jgi:hypothetical protein
MGQVSCAAATSEFHFHLDLRRPQCPGQPAEPCLLVGAHGGAVERLHAQPYTLQSQLPGDLQRNAVEHGTNAAAADGLVQEVGEFAPLVVYGQDHDVAEQFPVHVHHHVPAAGEDMVEPALDAALLGRQSLSTALRLESPVHGLEGQAVPGQQPPDHVGPAFLVDEGRG